MDGSRIVDSSLTPDHSTDDGSAGKQPPVLEEYCSKSRTSIVRRTECDLIPTPAL